jgi:hypothetical protein
MCQKCKDLVVEYYPNLSSQEHVHLLMSATAFPHCKPDYLKEQLEELLANTDGTLDDAINYAHVQLDKEFEAYKSANPELFRY